MLTRSKLAPDLYVAASLDAATGGSETSMLTNVCESASILETWEVVFEKAKYNLRNFDLPMENQKFEEVFKPVYQALRHGLAFDWTINYVVAKCVKLFPFSYHFEFSGTQVFVDSHTTDTVFNTELQKLDRMLADVFNWTFENYPEREVYTRLHEFTGKSSLEEAIVFMQEYRGTDAPQFVFPTSTIARINYLIYFMEMLSLSVGYAKRQLWTDRFNAIADGDGHVIVCGGKFNAFAYGNLDGTGVKWKRLPAGIKMLGLSERVQDSEYLRVFPDEMTFFRISENALYIDETLFPSVSFDNGPWLTTYAFRDATRLSMDTPMRMRVKYDFPQSSDKVKKIKVKGGENCAVKDAVIELNADGIGETQIVFRGNVSAFTLVDVDKEYPFGVFRTSRIVVSEYEWL